MDVGRPKKIESPELLWKLFLQYEQDRKNNTDFTRSYMAPKSGELVKEILRVHLSRKTFDAWLSRKGYISRLQDYRANKNGAYSEFSYIITCIDEQIDADTETGVMVGAFNTKYGSHLLGYDREEQPQNGVTIQIVGIKEKDNTNLIENI